MPKPKRPWGEILAVAFLLFAICVAAGQPQSSSPEMKKIFDEDQADRQINMAAMDAKQRGEWGAKVSGRDAARRKAVLDLLAHNALRTGDDFEGAAFVFQHGEQPDDFLLAHTLATVAIAKGSAKSRWIAAATLDRYLQRMKQPQIYGTQFQIGPNAGDKWTQEPFNRPLVPESLRSAMCVPETASQAATLAALLAGQEPPEPRKLPGCE